MLTVATCCGQQARELLGLPVPVDPSMSRPLFSIIVPSFNQAQFLGDALDSLLGQTLSDWEAIIVNDGSTDGTAAVADTYCRRDRRFRVIHKSNGGTGSALNVGLRSAQGQWICWLSSDDLFEDSKLQTHRDWIERHKDTRFFLSYFRELKDATGKIVNPPLWRPIPERDLQVIEMLACTYVHGNSICVQRTAWEEVGFFNESFSHGQDYDMWLRLLARHPAVFIPERTCITRSHSEQGGARFPQAMFYDSARAGIEFLLRNDFQALFPLLQLDDPPAARRAVDAALDVAANRAAFVYGLGPHLSLILRILEWAWRVDDRDTARVVRRLVSKRARRAAAQHHGTRFGLYWKAVAAAVCSPEIRFDYCDIPAEAVALAQYRELCAKQDAEAPRLAEYLRRFVRADQLDNSEIHAGERTPGEAVFLREDGTPGVAMAEAGRLSRWLASMSARFEQNVRRGVRLIRARLYSMWRLT